MAQQIPILNEWGCFDRITPGRTALEFAVHRARPPSLWVPGGHSWMLARPQGQADILTHLVRGQEFMAPVETRWRQLTPARVHAARRQLTSCVAAGPLRPPGGPGRRPGPQP